MPTLFSKNSEGGYRLRSLEVYNWGTFHKNIYTLKTNGRTSLLTGANGSGKTTLIDALLTLLVPSNKRFYNQSSGAEFKKERDELSYFWGFHGKTYSELDERSKTEQLRNKSDNPYSVLLACFQNSATLHTVTLVQVRWFTNGGLQKVFIVAPHQLSIDEHFSKGHFDARGEWKKKLVKLFPKTDIFNSFRDYSARFSELFGLKEKAMSLFNQTVGIKVLGDLTQFIRQQMLEEPDAEEQFKNLYDHYNDLLISHKAIQKDERQLELLSPVIQNKLLLEDEQLKLHTFSFIMEQLPFFTNKIEYELLEGEIARLDQVVETEEADKKIIEADIIQLEEEQKQLITQKASLNIDGQIQLLEKDIKLETEKHDKKKEYHASYVKLAGKLDLNTDLDEDSFAENLSRIASTKILLQERLDKLSDQRFSLRNDKQRVEEKIDATQNRITSLLSRKNRIPDDLIQVRGKLLQLLDAGENELPFVGELIRVKEDSLEWEDSIEKILHGFSLRLLVPEKYNKQVNEFVYSNDLQAKIVYERIDRRQSESLLRWPTEDDSLLNKIDIKNNESYSKWLEHQLVERYDYYCTDDLDVFYNCKKAVTSNGLIRNVNRHEKDDRPAKRRRIDYTLGWDNRKTVQLLQEEKYRLEKDQEKLFNALQELAPQMLALDEKKNLITLIGEIKTYTEIHWQHHAEKIHSLRKQIEEIKSSSDIYNTISLQLKEVEKNIRIKREANEEYIRKISQLKEDRKRKIQRRLNVQFEDLSQKGEQMIVSFIETEEIATRYPGTLDQLEMFRKECNGHIKSKHSLANNQVQDLQLKTTTLINEFVNPKESILKEFPDWSGDVMNIDASLKSLGELEDLYTTILNQRLVEHKRRFKEYMDRSMLDALTSFRQWMTNEEEKIEDIIEELNIPLKKITFNKNPDTYLQLECKTTKDVEIKSFRERLSATVPNALEFETQKDDTYREEVFRRIKELIGELQSAETWRRKVTDVRNWLTFNASEYTIADNKACQYHDNTASYSGGQKAQFTYAILGAAISHQFGIYQEGKQHKSLRFITVDEAFSKLDPEKSQFLMEFCAQLNLQILVVTPLDKINIAEPYIHAVHFVEIKNKKNSIVYNLTMEDYRERKEEFKQMATVTDDIA